MGTGTTSTFTVDDMTEAWEEYQRRGARDRDWPAWAALFTDDALYVEHCLGTFHGAGGILQFILDAMKPVEPMTFSIDWAIIDPPYVAFDIWNHMPRLGDSRQYSFSNLTLIEYAGGGKWRMEEDFYAPRDAGRVVSAWFKAGGTPAMAADTSIGHDSLAAAPSFDDPQGVRAMVDAWVAGRPQYTAVEGGWQHVWTHGVGRARGDETEPLGAPVDIVVADGKRAFLRCGRTGVALTHGGDGTILFEERAANPDEVAPVVSPG